jgi:electron transfer flavoprotein beta subunit
MRNKHKRVPAELTDTSPEQLNDLNRRGKLLEQWDLEHINADFDRCGLAGSPTKVFRIQSIVLKKEGFTHVEPTENGVKQMIHELVTDRTLG